MPITQLKIEGMTCLNCVTHVQKALEAVPGVEEVTVRQEEGASVKHSGVDKKLLVQAIQASGAYRAEVIP